MGHARYTALRLLFGGPFLKHASVLVQLRIHASDSHPNLRAAAAVLAAVATAMPALAQDTNATFPADLLDKVTQRLAEGAQKS